MFSSEPNDTMTTCATCSVYQAGNLQKLGLRVDHHDLVVALAGNPNVGKSTVFNRLTGLRQHTGNWPGKTVTRAEGGFRYQSHHYKLVDLPGTYSLLSNSYDEEVARDFLLFGQPHATIVVVDATALERNLNLVLQVLEITDRVVVCLNLMDEARRKAIQVDHRRLARDLGTPVVSTAARRGEGLAELVATVAELAQGKLRSKAPRLPAPSPQIKQAIAQLVGQLEAAFPGLPNARWVALRLLDGDERVAELVRSGELGTVSRIGRERAAADLHLPTEAGL